MERIEDCIYRDVCQQECSESCIRYLEMSYLLKHSNIPKARQCRHRLYPEDCDLKSFQQLADIQHSMIDFVNGDNSLYLHSYCCGNGKTTWSIKLMLQYFDEVWSGNGFRCRGLFVNIPTFLSKCKEVISHPDEDFESMRKILPYVDLVVFDDISVSRLSDFDYTTLLNYADQRVFNGKSTIYTGNVHPDELYKTVGHRLASRINRGYTIELKGLDRRNDSTSNNIKNTSHARSKHNSRQSTN